MATFADNTISIDGVKIGKDGSFEDYEAGNIQLVQDIQKPNELRFHLQKTTLTEDENEIRFSLTEELIGKKVELNIKVNRYDDEGSEHEDKFEFEGIIGNVNILRKGLKEGAVIEITAYSPDYLLMDSRHCYSYEKVTLKDIFTKTLDPYKIEVENDPDFTETIPYTVQYNETNYAFLRRMTERYGEWFYYDGKKLVLGKAQKININDPLKLGYDIRHYHYQLSMSHLNFAHAQHNYLEYGNLKNDPKDATANELHNLTDLVFDSSKENYSKETFRHLDAAIAEDNFDETARAAAVEGLGKKAQMMICHATSNRADLKPGSVFTISESYKNEDGEKSSCEHDELMIYKIIHTSDDDKDYLNEFWAVSANCEKPPYTYGDHLPKAGTQRAVVKDNKDPEKLGRIRVQFLWQKEQDEEMLTPWIRIAQPHGGGDKGFYFIPEIEEEVMVGFENGNAEKPYVIGTLFHGKQKPAEYDGIDDNVTKYIRTKNGHRILFVDKGDKGRIEITDGNDDDFKYSIILDTDEKLIQLKSAGSIRMYAEKDIYMEAKNHIILKADKDIDLESQESIVTLSHKDTFIQTEGYFDIVSDKNALISCAADVEIAPDGNMIFTVLGDMTADVTGATEIAATGDFTAKGMNATVEGNVNTEVKAGASMKVAGSATGEFDGGGMTTIKGGMIQVG
jgi:uncharacterized protein involved in type VI secretion and phage assembly